MIADVPMSGCLNAASKVAPFILALPLAVQPIAQ